MKKLVLILLIMVCCRAFGQVSDSVTVLKKVTITGAKQNVLRSSTPVQVLNGEALQQLNAQSVGDAARYFAGVVVKDYGGIGGLKTVSVRSLSANQTGVMYDGILLSDAQAGQIDLGKLSLDNLESVSLHNGQPADLLAPARSFSIGSVMVLKTNNFPADTTNKVNGKLSLKFGSFGFINPSFVINCRHNKHFSSAVNAEWQSANGAYSFKSYENGGAVSKRNNSDIDAIRLEYNAGIQINDSNRIRFKIYYYRSERGLPGAIVLFNDISHQRLTDKDFFSQATWQKSFSAKSRLLVSSKYAYNYKYYLDPDYPNTQGRLENIFNQREYYFSGAYEYKPVSALSFAYSSDYFINKLTRTDDFVLDFPNPIRNTWLNNLAAEARFNRVEINGNLLYTWQHDKVKTGNPGPGIRKFSPAIAVSYQPFLFVPLWFRAFYKDIFRTPTFNDLYYTNVGNTSLRPEYTKQYNLGITYKWNLHSFIETALFSVDGYYNKIKDKIIAIPRQNLFQWTMLNIGTVDAKGIDAVIQLNAKSIKRTVLSVRLAYTFQKALDVTDKNSVLYNTQLPYTPVHSGSISISATSKKISISYNVILSSYRYRLGEPIPENLVKEWATQDVSAIYTFLSKKRSRYKVLLQLNNLFNKQYEIIRYYPMPGFNYRAGFVAEF
jgi:outer membrane cobalamin receptor